MIGPFHEFSQLAPWIGGKDQYLVSGEALADLPSQAHLDERAKYWGADEGLEIVGECWAEFLALPNDKCTVDDSFPKARYVGCQSYYALAKVEEIDDAVQAIVCAVHDDFGPGKIWTTAPPVHIVCDDGMACAVNIGGARHYLMRSWVFHENGKQT